MRWVTAGTHPRWDPAHCPAINQLEMELGERSALFIDTEEKENKQKETLKS